MDLNLIVTLARSRSSVFMRCCIAMGLPVRYIQGIKGVNADGDFESYESNRGIKTDSEEYAQNETLKIMAPSFLFKSEIGSDAKIILLLRNAAGVVDSQGRIGMGQPRPEIRRMNYWRLMMQIKEWIESHQNPLLIVDTDDMMVNPEKWLRAACDFMGGNSTKVGNAVSLIQSEKSQPIEDGLNDAAQQVYQCLRAKCYTAT